MNRRYLASFLFLSLILLSQIGLAKVDGFWVWQPEPGGIKYLIPRIPGMNPSQFMNRYLRELKASPVYSNMENAKFIKLSTNPKNFSALPTSTRSAPNVAVILNRPNQMTDRSPYLKTVVSSFEAEGPRLYAIPVGLEVVVNPQDMDQFRKKMNGLDGQLGVGGDDAHPLTFGSEDTSQALGDISAKRDLEQTKYLKEYLKNGKGRVFYVCGSMQRAAIADGHSFLADINHITNESHRGDTGPRMLEIVADPESELAAAAGTTRFQTSNYHHAGVDNTGPQPGAKPKSNITAYNIEPDGSRGNVVKAIEFPENAGFATQFHPEFRGSPEEARIVKYVSAGWEMRGRYAPPAVVKCMEKKLQALLTASGGGSAP